MMKKLDAVFKDDKKKWDVFIRELEFNCINKFTTNINDSNIQMQEFACGAKLVNINASPYISQLKYTGDHNDTFFIVNSISTLTYRDSYNNSISQNGTSVFLPSSNEFQLESKTRRRSLSLFMKKSNILSDDDYHILDHLLWQKSDRLDSGLIIDNTIHKLYHPHSDLFLEKIFSLTSHLISFEIEKIKNNNREIDKINFINEVDTIISDNFKNQDFNLFFLARKIGVSERTIQNKCAPYGIKLHVYIQQKRVRYLKLLIDTQPSFNNEYLAIKSGFNSIVTANRVFSNEFGISISLYRKNNNKLK
jgi:AraC-like DNA-binding protein